MTNTYLLDNHKDEIITILEDTDLEKHFSIVVTFGKLFENCAELGNKLLENPERTLKKFRKQALKAQRSLLEHYPTYTEKCNVHIRISGVPTCPELHRTILPTSNDIGSFLQISGTVVRMTLSRMLQHERNYMCSKCKHVFALEADYEQRFIFYPPKLCPKDDCQGKNIIQIDDLTSNNCKDYQEIKIQEQISKSSFSSVPNSMWVTLEDDLVDCCKPGDDVTICGIVMRRWRPVYVGKKLDVELVLRANYLEVNNDQRSVRLIKPEMKEYFNEFWDECKNSPLTGRDVILNSICPELFGLYFVKLAVAIVLAGGSSHLQTETLGVTLRSEPHLLLVGDPGMGKSELLRFASRIIPRSVLTTGIGCTSAGLTVAAVMEDGEWQLEAGALVLSDGGICCIDEFNSMKEHDRASIHEAMEQQTISVAKASMVCKLNTRCSILAATNPKGQLDTKQSLSMNVAMASPLLSRFDLVLMLRDGFNPKWDETICEHILKRQTYENVNDKPNWTIELLQTYFSIIKNIHPVLTKEANSILRCYYQAQRQAPERNVARTTVRLLDSLVRLSQGHARLMFHQEVSIMDAVMAVALIESSMQGSALLLNIDVDSHHASFPDNPMQMYKELMSKILRKLGLFDLLELEIKRLQNNTTVTSKFFQENQSNNSFEISDSSNIQTTQANSTETENIIEDKKENINFFEDLKHVPNSETLIDPEIVFCKSNDVKRKRTVDKTDKPCKKSKKKKQLTESELINLIPSVNDGIFESDEVDFQFSLFEREITIEPSTQEKTESFNKNKKELNKFKYEDKTKTSFQINHTTEIVTNNVIETKITPDKKVFRFKSKSPDENKLQNNVSVNKTIQTPEKSIPNNSFNRIEIGESSKSVVKQKITPEKCRSFLNLQQFSFKKTPKKDENVIKTELDEKRYSDVDKQNDSTERKGFSQMSQVTVKTLFESDDLNDFDFDI